jgi:uncharacterized membrane protein YhaH (DUF805 family)
MTNKSEKPIDWIVYAIAILLTAGMMPISTMGDDYSYINEYKGFDSSGLQLVYWTFVGVFVLVPAVFLLIKKRHVLLLSILVSIIVMPTYAQTAYKYLNAKLDTSTPAISSVSLINRYSSHGGRFSRKSSICEIKGLSYPKSIHRFECGRGKLSTMLSTRNVLGKLLIIETKHGYFGHRWVSSVAVI